MMLWQLPALAIAGQAFLLAIALGDNTAQVARVLSAAVAAGLAVMTAAQLMAKHRFLEIRDSRIAEQLEEKVQVQDLLGALPHSRDALSVRRSPHHPPRWTRQSSYRLWAAGVYLFAATDLAIAAIAIFRPGTLN